MGHRKQRTISRRVVIEGRGLFRGAAVTMELLPAPEFHGIAFQRIDLADRTRIPAHVRFLTKQFRCTALTRLGASVEVVEHILAALAGLQVDNCLVRLDAPECPNGDGSARVFAQALLDAGIVEQTALMPRIAVQERIVVSHDDGCPAISVGPAGSGRLTVTYDLDYPGGVISRQIRTFELTPESFVRDIAFARTFVMESEVRALRAQGIGLKTTAQDLLVFDSSGAPIENRLRADDECVRHKILDCIGDLALAGAEITGIVHGRQSGHHHNHEVAREIASKSTVTRGRAA